MAPTIDIDSKAEREAAALDFFASELDQPQPIPALKLAGMHAQDAAELGKPPVRHPRYPTLNSYRAHERIADVYAHGDGRAIARLHEEIRNRPLPRTHGERAAGRGHRPVPIRDPHTGCFTGTYRMAA